MELTRIAQESRTDELTSALGTTSALISITILWVTFTILEALDSRLITRWGMRRRSSSSTTSRGGGGGEGEGQRDDEDEEDEVLVFCMTWVELSLGLILLCAWARKSKFLSFLTMYSGLGKEADRV